MTITFIEILIKFVEIYIHRDSMLLFNKDYIILNYNKSK